MAGHRADMMKLLKQIRKKGCTVERTGSGHWRITTPNGASLITSFSPKTPGALRDITRRLKKEGIEL